MRPVFDVFDVFGVHDLSIPARLREAVSHQAEAPQCQDFAAHEVVADLGLPGGEIGDGPRSQHGGGLGHLYSISRAWEPVMRWSKNFNRPAPSGNLPSTSETARTARVRREPTSARKRRKIWAG